MKKLFGNHRSLRILAMLLCVAMIAGVIGMQTQKASAADAESISFGFKTNLSSIIWEDKPTDMTVQFVYEIYNTSSKAIEVTYTWEGKEAGATEFEPLKLLDPEDPTHQTEMDNPQKVTISGYQYNMWGQKVYAPFNNTLTIVLDESLVKAKRGMIYRCKFEYVDGDTTKTFYSNEASVDYKAVVRFYNTNSRKPISSQKVKYEGKVTKPADPKNGNEKFECWVDANGNEFDFDTPITAPMSLYAKYAEKIRVDFIYSTDWHHMHGHKNKSEYYYVDETIKEITDVHCEVPDHKDEHIFMGWYVSEEPDAEKYVFGQALTGKEDIIVTDNGEKVIKLYGRWCTKHTAGEPTYEVTKAPTCTEPGSKKETIKCSNCGKVLSEKNVVIDALGHIDDLEEGATEKIVWTKEATCTEEGVGTRYVYCGREGCGAEVFSETVTEKKKDHTPGEWEVVPNSHKDGTCLAFGTHEEVQRCTVCQEIINTKTVNDEKGDHKYGDPYKDEKSVKKATCTENGGYWMVKKCEICGDVQDVEYITELAHHTEGETKTEVVKAATCTEDGSEHDVTYCAVCGEKIKESDLRTIDKLGHKPGEAVEKNKVDSTCAKTGSYDLVVYCTVCGDELSRETVTIPKKAHTYGSPVVENRKEADCDNDGYYESVVYCTACGAELSRTKVTIPATEHKAGDAVVEKVVAATCTVDGSYDSVVYCTECKDVISRETITVKAPGHQPKAAVQENIKNATCTATGSYDSVVYCSVCGLELSRNTVVVPKKAHEPGEVEILDRVEPTFNAEGSYNKVVKCKHCGETLSSDKVTIEKLTAEVTGISISGLDDAKKDYIVNDKINVDKIFVVYQLSDGTERKIPVTESMVTGFDSSKPAESLTLTVSVEGAKGTYNVAVNPTPVYTVEGDSTWDGANDMFLTVHRSYNDAITYSLHVNLLNGKEEVAVENYNTASGSLKLWLHKDYLKSLGEGTYTFTINFKDGFATVDVVIPNFEEPKNEEPKQEEPAKSETEVIPVEDNKTAVDNTKVEEKKADEKADSPKTADTSDIATWFILLILAMAAASVAMYCNKKRSSRA